MTLLEISKAANAEGNAVKAELACQVTKVLTSSTKAGKPYLDIEITDGTTTEKFKIWEDSDAYAAFRDVQKEDCVRIDASFWRNQYGLNVDKVRLRWLEKQEAAELFAGTPERRAALERDWNDVTAMVAEMADPRLRLLCQTYLNEHGEKFKRAARGPAIIIMRGAAACLSTPHR